MSKLRPRCPRGISSSRSPVRPPARSAVPQRIVSLSPTATESLFAIGAGPQVIAVDDQSDYPKNAPKTTLSGFTPNVEAIAGYKPDLVVVSYDPNNLVSTLRGLGIRVLVQDAATTLADAYAQIAAARQGHRPREAGRLRRRDDEEADRRARRRRHAARPRADRLPRARARPTTRRPRARSSASVYALFGLKNIADAADTTRRRLPEALGRVRRLAEPRPRSSSPTSRAAGRRRENGRRAAGLERPSRRCAPGRSCGSTTRSPRAGGRGSSTSSARSPARARASEASERRRALDRGRRRRSLLVAALVTGAPRRAGAHRPSATSLRLVRSHSCRSSTSTRSSRRRDEAILWHIRLPRVVLGALVGAMLALAGALVPGRVPQPARRPVPARRRRRRRASARRSRSSTRGGTSTATCCRSRRSLGGAVAVVAAYAIGRSAGRGAARRDARARRRHGRVVPHRGADVRPAAALGHAAGGLLLDPRRGCRPRAGTTWRSLLPYVVRQRGRDPAPPPAARRAQRRRRGGGEPRRERRPRAARRRRLRDGRHGGGGRGQRADRLRRDHRPARDPARRRAELPAAAAAVAARRRRLPRASRT